MKKIVLLALVAMTQVDHLSLGDSDPAQIFNFWAPFDQGANNSIFGPIRTVEGSWFNTLTMGWVYLYPNSTKNGFWIWTKELGWFFSNQERFPEGYLQSTNSWILLDLSIFEIRYLEAESSSWRSFQKAEFEFFNLNGEVPEELQELRYRSTGENTQHTIVFGRYVFIEETCDPNGCRKLVYLFNALDGYFYTESMPEALLRYKVEVDGDSFSITQEERLFDFPAIVETYEIGWN